MLKYQEPNPLTIHGLRQVDHLPPHFTRVQFDLRVNQKVISDWIWENLEGRFWIGDIHDRDSNGAIISHKCAAFEHASEATMFTLILDTVNRYEVDFDF